jgi:hypothetical protein
MLRNARLRGKEWASYHDVRSCTHKDSVNAMVQVLPLIEIFVNVWPHAYSIARRGFFPVDLRRRMLVNIVKTDVNHMRTIRLTALPTSLKLATSSV